MDRLPVSDAGWLLIEERERPMHVGGLQLFSLPNDAPPSFLRDIAASAFERTDVRPPFNQRLAQPYGLAGLYHWVEDEVELDYHFHHLALPEPGRVRELLALVSALHSHLLDRHRPLWESYLIEGLEGGRFAAYTKIHHSVLDGVAAMRQLVKSFSDDPDVRDLPPPWATRSDDGEDVSGDTAGVLGAASRLLGSVAEGAASLPGVGRALATQLARARRDPGVVVPFQAPPSMLNVRLTGARRFVAQSYSLERIRRVRRALDATINDVLLAMSATALRTYLQTHQALPARPLIALVPVSFRRDDESESGNAISLVPANLATHLADPVERVELIKSSMDAVKDRVRDMSPSALISYGLAMTAPLILGQLTGLSGRVTPSYNLVISNLPGPDEPLYWNGAKMQGLYPLSVLPEGYALNITQTSYAGSMEFGITADRRALPRVQRLIDHLADALDELETAAGLT